MSMALALEFTAGWLRDKNGWTPNQCGVQFDAVPPCDGAGMFYVAIDDAGVEPGPEETDSLLEILSINVGIWRRPEHLTKSQRGQLKLPTDKYLLGAFTLHDLERQVIIHNRNGLHKNYEFLTGINVSYNLPHAEWGAPFTTPWTYRGRGRMESITIESVQVQASFNNWYGYRLRFRGLRREQKLRSAQQALG